MPSLDALQFNTRWLALAYAQGVYRPHPTLPPSLQMYSPALCAELCVDAQIGCDDDLWHPIQRVQGVE